MRPLLPAQLPFVGREADVAWLERAWRAGGTVLVEGEGGIGKTRLVVDFAAAHGPLALVRCRPADAEAPLASIARALRVLAGPQPATEGLPAWVAAELSRLLPELGPAPLPLRSEAERARFGEAVALAWRHWAAGSFDAVVLDDWHLADDASQALLPHVLARAADGGGEPLRELLVYRPELGPEAAARLQRLRDAGAPQRRLEALSPAAVLDLLRQLSGVAHPERFARRLAAATAGHPFHIVEALRHLVELGLLTADAGGAWHTPFDEETEDYRELPLPASVRDAVLARVRRLPEPAQRVLDAAALAGEPFDAALLAPACALSEVEADLAIEQALQARLLRARDGGGWGFVHDLVAQALASALGDDRRRLVHRRLALGAAAAGAPPALVAQHHEAGGEPHRAVAWRCRAAEAAMRLLALDEAVAHWRRAREDGAAGDDAFAIGARVLRALELSGQGSALPPEIDDLRRRLAAGEGTPEGRAGASVAIAGALAHRDNGEAALATLAELPAPLAPALHAAALRVRSDALRSLGRVDESEAVARAALAEPGLDADLRGRLLDTQTMNALAAGRLRDALGFTEQATALARAAGDGWSQARSMIRRASLLMHVAEAEVAEAALREAADQAGRLGMTGQRRATLFNLCVLHSSRSRPREVLAVARECWELPPPMPLEPLRTQMRLAFVEAHLALGALGDAWHWMRGAIDDAIAVRQLVGRLTTVLTGLELLTLVGEAGRAQALLDGVDAQAQAQMPQFVTETRLVQAECALLDGDLPAARAQLAALGPPGEAVRVGVRHAVARAAVRLAEGDAAGALAALPPDDAPGHNDELRWRALAVRLQAEHRAGGASPASLRAAEAALAADGVHAVAQWLLHRALRQVRPAHAVAYAGRVQALAASLAAYPAQQAAFRARWA